jgi:hypothetical protein
MKKNTHPISVSIQIKSDIDTQIIIPTWLAFPTLLSEEKGQQHQEPNAAHRREPTNQLVW